MKLSGSTISALVHVAVLAVIVFLVKAEPRLPTPISAFVFGEDVKKEEPPPPPPKKEEPPPKKKDAPKQKAAAKAVTPTEVAAQTPKTENTAQKPLMDLGLVMDGDDGEGIPEGAVVVPSDLVGPPPTKKTDLPAQGGLVPQIVKKPACEEELVPPEPLSRADVEYPPDVEGVTGRVVAVVKVNADGSIKEVKLLEGVHPDVDRAVLKSLEQWKFKAARRCTQAVEGTFRFAVRFEATE